MSAIAQLLTRFSKVSTPLSEVSLLTSLAIGVVACVGFVVDRWVTACDFGPGLMWVAAFYFTIGVAALVRQAIFLRRIEEKSAIRIELETWRDNIGPIHFRQHFSADIIKRHRKEKGQWIGPPNRITSNDNFPTC